MARYAGEMIPVNPHEHKLEHKLIEDCDRHVLIDYYTFSRAVHQQFGTPAGSSTYHYHPYAGGGVRAMGKEKSIAHCDEQIRKLASGLALTRENFGWSVWSLPIEEYKPRS